MANEDTSNGIPGWFVTFADMMALLLTFFVMLVSVSELKSEEKYQALMDGFQQQFGNYEVAKEVAPGQLRPRHSSLAKWVSANRRELADTLGNSTQSLTAKGDMNNSPTGGIPQKLTLGTVLYFQEDKIELDDHQRLLLHQLAEGLRGSRQKMEIRGHTSNRRAASATKVRDNWDLSFERCRRVMQYLVEEQQIDSRTLRISAFAANEPMMSRESPAHSDSRVELMLLDEFVHDTKAN